MKNNIYAVWADKKEVKIKNRGIASIATSAMSNNTKIQSKNNRHVWPTSFCASTKDSYETKKVWTFIND